MAKTWKKHVERVLERQIQTMTILNRSQLKLCCEIARGILKIEKLYVCFVDMEKCILKFQVKIDVHLRISAVAIVL